MTMQQFENKVALVTGAGSGMGRSTAILLARRGAAVTVVGRREHKLAEVVAEITAAGGRALAVPGDVSRPEDSEQAVADYSSAKHGIRGLTRTAAIQFGGKGIRVNELQPGVIDTEMTDGNLEGTQHVVENGIPMGRMGTGDEIATAVAFLLSDEASYINGSHLAVDGGFLA
jgi:NAD(P)-dependent dehydrogenase (short-subunit alcohol dehydrogenase family)